MAERILTTMVKHLQLGDEVYIAGHWRTIDLIQRGFAPPDFKDDQVAGAEHSDSRRYAVIHLAGADMLVNRLVRVKL